MSSDLQQTFNNPAVLFFDPAKSNDARQHYRLVDAPLTRNLIGLGLTIAGQSAPGQDWDWSSSWSENKENGAIPSLTTLSIARIFCSFLFPISLIAFYQFLRTLTGKWLGLAGTSLLGLNSLLLLHTRRAMAESMFVALFLIILWLTTRPHTSKKLWAISILLAVFLQTKQLALPLVVGIILYLMLAGWIQSKLKGLILSATIPISCLMIGFYLFNPVMWQNPSFVAPKMLQERQFISQNQTSTFQQAESNLALTAPTIRLAALLGQTFFAPPAYFDIGNYSLDLKGSIKVYQANILTTILSGWIWGGLLLLFTLLGLILWLLNTFRDRSITPNGYTLAIFLAFIQAGAYLGYLSLGFQRYYLAFIPLFLVISLSGITRVFTGIRQRRAFQQEHA